MQELESLKSMWSAKVKRKVPTMPQVKYNSELNVGTLDNDDWYFKVPYAFREALDIKFEERKKDKKSYMVWTQGPILSFKDGDTFTAKNQKSALQVRFSNPMGWDPEKNQMYQGSIVFDKFDVSGHKHTKLSQHSCTQMDFLKILISGVISC
ncbi:hypothetical protein N473_04025 [Pseudoalteromonas luteoviolacea CPMOR-1]|uniref:Uncharacterized protein n=1 Tax=Pseudoalteromonas luteoviolacea CPMOR-1 TaxID=1365248 RepID=A0A167IGP6_9GAMM|nr:hypothetical protein [Pseudoalteromonas luteoviolacea]KZN59338.1 hypothetical protein N473_04025 [Pseudoalteromonas luteoviolacea CPMOR-1]